MSRHVRRLSREEARRVAIRAQLLDAHRPPDLTTAAAARIARGASDASETVSSARTSAEA
ncbi:MAG TPA: hypothetical protein VJA85_03940 [Candidatus Limnocylindria bacterium]|nr:hypothetical protein [Candidatus Limnocylindria bacterium]